MHSHVFVYMKSEWNGDSAHTCIFVYEVRVQVAVRMAWGAVHIHVSLYMQLPAGDCQEMETCMV